MALVKWLGYDSKHNSWIPESSIQNIEMAERSEEFEQYNDVNSCGMDTRSKLESEYSRIEDDFQDADMPDDVKMKYDITMDKVKRIEREQDRRLGDGDETSFIDDDDDERTCSDHQRHTHQRPKARIR